VYVFTRDGNFTNRTFGGQGTAHGKFMNDHGITYDHRVGQLAVSDRENHRVQFFDIDTGSGGMFEYKSTLSMDGHRPCNFRILQNSTHPALDGMVVSAQLDGSVRVLDEANKLVSVIDVVGLIGNSTGSLHPHDAIFMPNGDIVVVTWNPGHVSYWKLLPKLSRV
jgi:hypothetical protein